MTDPEAYEKPTLTVWRYDTPLGAEAGERRLKGLQDRGHVTVHDAISVAWLPGAHEPRVGLLRHPTMAAAGSGSVLEALVARLVLPSTAGARAAALAERLRGTGIDRAFLEDVTAQLTPGTSALLVLSSDADLEAVRPVVERGLARADVVLRHAVLTERAPEALQALVSESGPDER